CLHTTVKFICYPLQCYNCYCFGHFTQSYKSTTTCGFCSQDHPTRDCKCPSNTHLCTLCSGPHATTTPECKTQKYIIAHHLHNFASKDGFNHT
ncbi:hypothetical protein K439DRAFT_1371965, partial [Ramaria rubella]